MAKHHRSRRVKWTGVTPHQEFDSVFQASIKTKISMSTILKRLDQEGTGWVSLDPPLGGALPVLVDGVEYPSMAQASLTTGISPQAFKKYRAKKLTKFITQGHQVEVLESPLSTSEH
jgi:hypothetical protein